jgi:dihydroxy-acid dehydratase
MKTLTQNFSHYLRVKGSGLVGMSEEKFNRRSQYWFGLKDKGGYIHRERLRNQGYAPDVFDGRPVIGIANTWSELNPCNGS